MTTQTAQLVQEIDGVSTEVLVQRFADCTLLLITQLGKVGSLIRAKIPDTAPLIPAPAPDPNEPNAIPLPPPPPSLEVTPLLGTAQTEHDRILQSLYAAQAATLIWTSSEANLLEVERKDVVVGIALRRDNTPDDLEVLTDHERGMFHSVMGMVREVLSR